MTTRTEKIRKLRALARDKGAFKHEAALALAKAQELEITCQGNRPCYWAAP
jgi:hypothetical protein